MTAADRAPALKCDARGATMPNHKHDEDSRDDLDGALAAIDALHVAAAMLPRAAKSRRVRLSVTDAEHDRLAAAAHTRGLNSQQLVRDALLTFLEEVGREYGSGCPCLKQR